MLPGELVEVMDILGFNWPQADEDKIFECSRAWEDYAGDVERVIADAERACREAIEHNRGAAITAFEGHWRELGGHGDLRHAADAARVVSEALDLFGKAVFAMKTATITQLGIAAAAVIASVASAIFTAGLSTLAGAGAIQAARIAIREIIQELIEKIVKTIIPKLKHEAGEIFEKIIKGLRRYLDDLVTKLRQMLRRGDGPVEFYYRKSWTPEEQAQVRRYIEASERARKEGRLSTSGRVSTKGDLRRDSNKAAHAEKQRAERADTPYQGQAGHAPDSTWTGRSDAYEWHDQTSRVNASLGRQAQNYPVGFKPSKFRLGEPRE
ncbi:MAG: hypothetical protein ACRDRY_15480 [Pseudonocardiaceae bacterium]